MPDKQSERISGKGEPTLVGKEYWLMPSAYRVIEQQLCKRKGIDY